MTTPAHPTTTRANDVDLAYVEQGHGEPVVFVHGSVNDYRSWRNQLASAGERYRAVAYSRRYHWPNAQPTEGTVYAVDQHAADLAAFIETLGLAPAHLVGSSYGALTALTMTARRPELVRSLALGEPPLLNWLPRLPGGAELVESFVTHAFQPAGQALARGELEAGVRLFINGVIGEGTFDRLPAPARQMMLDNAFAMRAETASPPERYFPDLSPEDLIGLDTPTLLLHGELSPAMFGRVTDELARVLPNATRATIPAASHGMHGQNPAAYNEALLAFLARA